MPRLRLSEIHDHPRCPATLRDAATDFLGFLANTLRYFDAIAPKLAAALERSGSRRLIDLASGGGGPWPGLMRSETLGCAVDSVVLTDLHPNEVAFTRLGEHADRRFSVERSPIDATRVPSRLRGARTIFGALHHFEPEQTLAILRDAVACRQPIAAFEPQERRASSLMSICLLPLAAWLAAPFMRPFSWSRLAWTYPLPLAPFVIWYDGLVSCLRTYSPDELWELVRQVDAPEWSWEIGRQRMHGLPLEITYLIGTPPRRGLRRMRVDSPIVESPADGR